nr:serine/arginine repetitive matrix protein 2-like isoform X3 [Megalopta genalis]
MKRKDRQRHGKNPRFRSKEFETRGVHMDMKTSWSAQELTTNYTNLDEMARFQQKQLQEKEQKLLQLYDQQQQRAYQVVQRGSAGSNGSSYGSSVSQHTVTKTSSNSHTTSTSQGGKVRQMFDERRQTTVKGIDRSYPLEPLENKPRKQANGNAAPRNGNSTVNRQSVSLKRVVRADVNSNLNAGKPIVSYHEEIARESFGSPGRQQLDDDEFGNENHVAQYANGNHRDELQIEEVLDQDTIERNRMMAKLHLMEYDETLKHRIKNDLESEEFPEDFMVDVPDKHPKQSISKKLSQAEARLERFRNANAKRISNTARNTGPSHVPKKRVDPILPGKAAPSGSKDRKASTSERFEEMLSFSDTERTVKRGIRGSQFYREQPQRSATSYGSDSKARLSRLSPESSRDGRSRSGSPKFFWSESEKSVADRAIDSKAAARSSLNYLNDISKGGSPKFFCREPGRSATSYAIDSKAVARSSRDYLKDRRSRSGSPEFFCKESGKSATTYAIDRKAGAGSNTIGRSSPDFSKDRRSRSGSPKFFCKESEKSATTYAIDSKAVARSSPDYLKDRRSRSGSPKFFCKESEKSATTYAIDSKAGIVAKPIGRLSPQLSKGSRSRSESPKYFCKEPGQSATNYAIDPKTIRRLSPDFSSDRSRSASPNFFRKESERSATTYAIDPKAKIAAKIIGRSSPVFSEQSRSRSGSPKFFCKESEKSATTYAIDRKTGAGSNTIGRSSPDFSKDRRSRSGSPKFFCKESEKSATTYAIDSKAVARSSPDYLKDRRSRSGSAKFFCKESEKSATTYAIDSKSKKKLASDLSKNRSVVKIEPDSEFVTRISTKSPVTVDDTVDRFIKAHELDKIRTPSPTGSVKSYTKIDAEIDLKPSRAGSPNIFERLAIDRSASPQFLHRESRKFSPTAGMTAKGREIVSKSPDTIRNLLKHRDHRKVSSDKYEFSSARTTSTKSPEFRRTGLRKSNASPQFVSERSATIMFVTPETITKTRTGYARTGQKARSPAFSIGKMNSNIANRFVDSSRRDSPEDVAEKSKRRIRSSVSRYFLEQCERASRNAEAGARNTVQKHRVARNADSYRVSPPVSLKHMEAVGPMSKSPQLHREEPGRFVAANVDRSRSGTPEFFCYETDKMATTVSLKPRPSKDSISPARPESRLSKSPDVITSIKNVNDSRSSSPMYMTDRDKRILTLFPSKHGHSKPSKGLLRKHSKSPLPTTFSKTKSPKTSDAYNINRDTKSGSRRNTPSTSPEFFCYETDKMATTVSLKPRPSRDYSMSPEPARSESRSSNRPDISTSGKNVNETSRSSSPVLAQYITDSRRSSPGLLSSKDLARKHSKSPPPANTFSNDKSSGSPEFFCYETEKMATTVSLKPRPSNDTGEVYPKSPVGSKRGSSIGPDTRDIDDSRSSSPLLSRYTTEPLRSSLSSTKPKSPKDQLRRHTKTPPSTGTYSKGKSPRNPNVLELPKDTKPVASRSPDFFCYESEKSATTVGLRPRPSNSKSSKFAELRTKSRSPKSPEQLAKEARLAIRRGSGNVLRSTGLIRDIIKHQRHRESDCAASTLSRRVERASGLKQGSKDGPTGNVCSRERELVTLQSETRSFASVERTSEEIAVTDGYAKRGTYSKSSRTSPTNCEPTKSKRTSLDSDMFCLSRKDRGEADTLRRSPSPGGSVFRGTKRRTTEDMPGPEDPGESSGSGRQTVSLSRQAPTLGSIELVRKVMRGGPRAVVKTLKTQELEGEPAAAGGIQRQSNSSVSGTAEVNDGGSSSKNYERTDSVESALRRFDSIDAENGAEPVPDTWRRSGESVAEKRQTEESRAESFEDDSRTISLKALERSAHSPRSTGSKPSGTRLKRTSTSEPSCRAKAAKREEESDRRRKRIAKGGDSAETAGRTRALACRRKLFRDVDSAVERARSRRDKVGKSSKSESAGSRRANKAGSATGMSDGDGSLSVKHLRSIEDIRRSIEDTSSSYREEARASRSAVASNASRGEGKPRVSSSVACDRVGKQVSQAKRSERLGASRDSERFVKSATGFSRVAKSPSLEPTKPAETNNRARRSVLSPPSKSPDMATRRPSTELKGSDAKPTKRTTPTKDAEPIGNRKTTATTTTTRKSTDVVDGDTVLENGLHLQDQTVETKYDNDLHTAKKTFVIDDDEQPPKENNGLFPRKPLLKRPSIEKPPETKSNWRRKHEDFINAIRSAKQVQAHLAAGGKLSDLPPPPPSDTSDYIQCPHCGRKFNKSAADRHIPKCEHMLHNKPVHSRAPKPRR